MANINLHKHSFDYVTLYMWIAEMDDLSLNDKLIFSKIYGYCKSHGKRFYGTVKYLSKQTSMSPRSVSASLKTLLDKNLILRKSESDQYHVAKYSYTVNDMEIYNRTGLTIEQINRITIDSLRQKIEDFEQEIKKYSNEQTDPKLNTFTYDYIHDYSEPNLDEQNEDLNEDPKDSEIETLSSNTQKVIKREPIVMDFTVTQKNGFLQSKSNKPKPKKNNKFTQFASYARQCNYSDKLMEIVLKYIKWLLGNRRVDIEQWKAAIDNLNLELSKINNKAIREEAAIDAFSNAFAGGFQKINVDRYKYGKYMNNTFTQDKQISNSQVREVSSGVYEVVAQEQNFVKDENGNIITF